MTITLVPPTTIGFVRVEAERHDVHINDEQAEYILWNFTGYPSFWPAGFETPAHALRKQLHDYFEIRKAGFLPCQRCGQATLSWLCDKCDEIVSVQLPEQLPAPGDLTFDFNQVEPITIRSPLLNDLS